jgi:hypothetical protein
MGYYNNTQMSFVLDHNYDINANKLSNIINYSPFSFVLLTNRRLYKIRLINFIIDQIKFEFFVADFARDYRCNVLYLLSNDDILCVMSLNNNTIIKIAHYKIIRMTTLKQY